MRSDTIRTKATDILLLAISLCAIVYQLLAAHFMLLSANRHLNLHLAFALVITLLVTLRTSRTAWFPLALLLGSIFCTAWVHFNIDYLEMYSGFPGQPAHVLLVGVALIFVILECGRRSFGFSMIMVILIFTLYPYFGRYLPGIFHAPALKPAVIIFRQSIGSMGTGGIYGSLLGMSADAIFLFIVFAALLQTTGATKFVMQISRSFGRRLSGGVGMTAIVSSALMGTMSGSVVGNIATTGAFTIPLMKKAGYKPFQAGAIEAMASTGGQIMPPVMGYTAFLMIAFTGIPYIELCKMVAIPAILYYFCGALYVQFQAARMGLRAPSGKMDSREMVTFAPVFIVPLAALIVLLADSYPLDYSISVTIAVLVLIGIFYKPSRQHFLKEWRAGVIEGAVSGAQVALICAGMSILLESISLVALIMKIPAFVVSVAGQNVLVALLLSMVASLILGAGVSATAAYVVVAIVIGPALVSMGIDVIQAHLFAFWFACIGFLTPPIAVAAVVASRIARAPFWPTALEGTKVAVSAFLIPFLIIWCPSLILRPMTPGWAILGPISGVILVVTLQVAISNYYLTEVTGIERALYGALSVHLFLTMAFHATPLLVGGDLFFALLTTHQAMKRRRKQAIGSAI